MRLIISFLLILAGGVEPVTPSCPNPTMSNFLRTVFLSYHNNVRGRIARGQTEVNGNWGIAPPASLMHEMKYDCWAESYAQSHVRSCDGKLSPPESRPGYKENIHVLNTLATDDAGAAQNAMTTWWNQLAANGIRTDMLFSSEVRHRPTNIVTKFTKMAWWNNKRVGCAVQRCPKFYFVSCMYGPGGNDVGEHVYNVGAVCSGCPASCNPLVGLCPY
ncbi:SCP-like protein [Necator americanus]|uniref:SCP-like protein n=1 Tax=Necator americanus TaxID=51031 RepID=W2TXS9_NECAM|nr:SCP-like protein [Necator americanus]ETN85846.1 SCP-like protein [Necator americanus]